MREQFIRGDAREPQGTSAGEEFRVSRRQLLMRNEFQTDLEGQRKEDYMKRAITNSLMAVALVAGTALHAQSSQRVTANVPFDFQVGAKLLSAGEYSISPVENQSAVLHIANREITKQSALAMEKTWDQDKGHARLVFLNYAGDYFLAKICNGEECTSIRAERRAKELAKTITPETVTVLAGAF